MKKDTPNIDTLNVFLNSAEKLINRMEKNGFYDSEIKSLFNNAIPKKDMTKKEVERHFKDKIRQSQMIATKLEGWLEGYIEDHLSKSTPNELMNEGITYPKNNAPLPIKTLKNLYGLKQTEKTIYNWIEADKLIPSSNSGTRLYYRIDFERLLNNKGMDFDRDRVEKLLSKGREAVKKINGLK